MMELATPTMKRKDPLIAAPVVFGSAMGLSAAHGKPGRTNNTPHATHAIQLVVDIRADGNGDVLKVELMISTKIFRKVPHTTTTTMVLWPSEK